MSTLPTSPTAEHAASFFVDAETLRHLRATESDLRRAISSNDPEAVAQAMQAINELLQRGGGFAVIEHEDAVRRVTGASAEESRTAAVRMRDTFLQRYHELKREANLQTQREVAEASGAHVNTIRGLEQGAQFPQWRTVCKLAQGFSKVLKRDIDPYWLQGLGETPAAPPSFSSREKELIRLARDGMSDTAIAQTLVLEGA